MIVHTTLNPDDKHASITLSNGNLTATATESVWRAVRATLGKSSGKWYFEVTLDFNNNIFMIGVGTSAADISNYPGYDNYGWSYQSSSGKLYHETTGYTYGDTYDTGDVVGVALDIDNGKIYFSKNGVWQNSSNPETQINPAFTGLSGILYPMMSPHTAETSMTVNFGASSFAHTVPSGFIPLNSLLKVKTSIGLGTIIRDRVGLGISGILIESLTISEPVIGILRNKTVLSGEPINGLLRAKVTLLAIDFVNGLLSVLSALDDPEPLFINIDWDIFLDGQSIKQLVTDLKVEQNQSAVHNSISISSTSSELYRMTHVSYNYGESRIQLKIGTRTLYFLLEDKRGSNYNFTLWGRSLSAQYDTPHESEIDYSVTDTVLASDIANSLINGTDWQCADWLVPKSFEFSGTPIQGLVKLANSIGALVRCTDSGTIVVRAKYPVRPVDMNKQAPVLNYSREENIVTLGYATKLGSGLDAVQVRGIPAEVLSPTLAVEPADGSRTIGTDVYVRIYWANSDPIEIPETLVTSGTIQQMGVHTETIRQELVTFINGVGKISKPLYVFRGIEWIGLQGTNLSYNQYSNQLLISNGEYRVALVTYDVEYYRYLCTDHNVIALLGYISYIIGQEINILCKMNWGIKQAKNISSPYLTSISICITTGTAFLDDTYYDKRIINLDVPYYDEAIDSVLISLSDTHLNENGNFQIINAQISIVGAKISNKLEVMRCLT